MTRLVEVGRYDNLFRAHALAAMLDEAGIEADVMDGEMGSALSHVGAIGIRVVVREEDAVRARAAIEANRLAPPAPDPTDPATEVDWRDDGEGVAEGRFGASQGGDEAGAERTPETPAETWARRTSDMALLGIVLLPLSLVALYRSLRPPPGVRESAAARRNLRNARIWAGVGCAVIALVVLLAAMYGR